MRAEQLGDGPDGGFIFDPFFIFFLGDLGLWTSVDYAQICQTKVKSGTTSTCENELQSDQIAIPNVIQPVKTHKPQFESKIDTIIKKSSKGADELHSTSIHWIHKPQLCEKPA